MYVGIDVGKTKHLAGFISTTLLQRHERFEACPVLVFEQSREGFRSLVDRIRLYVPLAQVYVLLEHMATIIVPWLNIYKNLQKRAVGMLKTDKRDALSLGNHLYNQLEKGIQLADKTHLVRRLLPPTEAALQLKRWMHHRYELSREGTRRKNKLVAICDELFPEFTQIMRDPNAPMVLAIREHFPTPQAVATATLSALAAWRTKNRPSNAQLARLQQLASQSIGTKEVVRPTGCATCTTSHHRLPRECQLIGTVEI